MTAQNFTLLLDRDWKLVTVARDGSAPVDVSSRGLVFTFSRHENENTVVLSQNRSITTSADVSPGTLRFERRFSSNLMFAPRLSRVDDDFVYRQLLVGEVEYSVSDAGLLLRKVSTGELRLAP